LSPKKFDHILQTAPNNNHFTELQSNCAIHTSILEKMPSLSETNSVTSWRKNARRTGSPRPIDLLVCIYEEQARTIMVRYVMIHVSNTPLYQLTRERYIAIHLDEDYPTTK
jgi:hypothetical protein